MELPHTEARLPQTDGHATKPGQASWSGHFPHRYLLWHQVLGSQSYVGVGRDVTELGRGPRCWGPGLVSFVMLTSTTAQTPPLLQLRHSPSGFDPLGLDVTLEAAQESEHVEAFHAAHGIHGYTSLGVTAELNGHPEKAFCLFVL